MVESIKQSRVCAVACVKADMFTDWFDTLWSETRRCTLPNIKDDTNLGFLLNGDDIILRAESESDLENMLNVISVWCHKWKLAINQSKTHK